MFHHILVLWMAPLVRTWKCRQESEDAAMMREAVKRGDVKLRRLVVM